MIKFDLNHLSVEIVRLKSITTALGGSISVIDEVKTTPAKEVYRRIPVPLATARAFIVATKKITKYLKPVYVALAWYDKMVISMERHPLAGLGTLMMDTINGPAPWVPNLQVHIQDIIKPIQKSKQWYFDGRYMYSFENDCLDTMIRNATFLSSNGAFRKVVAQTIDLQCLHTKADLVIEDRGCISFVTAHGDSSISPPIWKNLEQIGAKQMAITVNDANDYDDDDDDDDKGVTITTNKATPFDAIDSMMAVNLNFALKAGNEIGKLFGFDQVEPLQLARLMIELHTVNLPNIERSIKSTYNCGMLFTHALAWLLGFSRYANTLDTYLIMKSLLSYLTRKGIFRRNSFNPESVFMNNQSIDDLPLLSLSALKSEFVDDPMGFDFAALIANAKQNKRP